MDPKGKVAVLTGGARIGQVVAQSLALHGCNLALTYRGSRDAFVPYFTSKTAVVALTESLALELAPEVLVNAVAPRPILMPRGLSPTENDEVIDATPFRR